MSNEQTPKKVGHVVGCSECYAVDHPVAHCVAHLVSHFFARFVALLSRYVTLLR